jgi:hypothetical protein
MRTLPIFLTILACAMPVRAEQITLRFEGVHDDEDGKAIAAALSKAESVKVAGLPTKEQPTAVVTFDPAKIDVGDLAKTVAAIPTPNRSKGTPGAILVLKYQRLDGSSASDEVYLPQRVERGCAALKGVDAKKCRLDIKRKELLIRLDDQGGARLADIKKGFPGLMLE